MSQRRHNLVRQTGLVQSPSEVVFPEQATGAPWQYAFVLCTNCTSCSAMMCVQHPKRLTWIRHHSRKRAQSKWSVARVVSCTYASEDTQSLCLACVFLKAMKMKTEAHLKFQPSALHNQILLYRNMNGNENDINPIHKYSLFNSSLLLLRLWENLISPFSKQRKSIVFVPTGFLSIPLV